MKSQVISFAFFIALTGSSAGAHAQVDSARQSTSEVQIAANAERSVRPDVATFRVSFNASGKTPVAAGQALAARADSIRKALQTLGIPRDSLVSGSRWYWWRGRIETVVSPTHYIAGPPDARGNLTSIAVQDTTYRAADAIELHIHDLRKVGPAIDTLVAHRVTDMSPVRFEASDISAAQESALREATDRARRQAAAIAEASGSRLGRPLSLSTQQQQGPQYMRLEGLDAISVSSSFSGTPIGPPGTEVIEPAIKVRVTVYGRWELLARP